MKNYLVINFQKGVDMVVNTGRKAFGVLFSQRSLMLCLMLTFFTVSMFADGDAGASALTTATSKIRAYIPLVRQLCYVLAAVVAIVGAISVYIKMNNEEQDVKKSIMMIVGACVFLVVAAETLPLFFGEAGQ